MLDEGKSKKLVIHIKWYGRQHSMGSKVSGQTDVLCAMHRLSVSITMLLVREPLQSEYSLSTSKGISALQ